MKSGSCLCGAVRLEVSGELKAPDACHCRQCRQWSGHYFVSTDVPRERLSVSGMEHVAWFDSSPKVRRGFCRHCGSSLFFDPPAKDWIGVAMGAFDGATGTHTELHVFAGEKGDYYDIDDGLPCFATVPGRAPGMD